MRLRVGMHTLIGGQRLVIHDGCMERSENGSKYMQKCKNGQNRQNSRTGAPTSVTLISKEHRRERRKKEKRKEAKIFCSLQLRPDN